MQENEENSQKVVRDAQRSMGKMCGSHRKRKDLLPGEIQSGQQVIKLGCLVWFYRIEFGEGYTFLLVEFPVAQEQTGKD